MASDTMRPARRGEARRSAPVVLPLPAAMLVIAVVSALLWFAIIRFAATLL